jgi:hypothetical protein
LTLSGDRAYEAGSGNSSNSERRAAKMIVANRIALRVCTASPVAARPTDRF